MARETVLHIAALSGFLLAASLPARAEGGAPISTPTTHSGIRTDRLSPRQLRIWKSLVSRLHETDRQGTPRYPKLRSLWQAATSAGPPIYIELPERTEGPVELQDGPRPMAGRFIPPSTDADGKVRPPVIQLDRCAINECASDLGGDGFQRFKGLGRKERYLEVLGHELAHAAAALHDPEYAAQFRELEREVAGFVEFWRANRKAPGSNAELLRRAERINALTKVLEAPARAAEVEVWRELSLRRGGNSLAFDRENTRKARVAQGLTK